MDTTLFQRNDGLLFLSVILTYGISLTAVVSVCKANLMTGHFRLAAVFGGGIVLGLGMWSTRLIGLLGNSTVVPITINTAQLIIALIIACVFSLFAVMVSQSETDGRGALPSAVLLGVGVASLHCIEMSALEVEGNVSQSYLLLLVSAGLSFVFFYLGFRVLIQAKDKRGAGIRCAVFVGTGLAIMQYAFLRGVYVNKVPDLLLVTAHASAAKVIGYSMLTLCLVMGIALPVFRRICDQMGALSEARRLLVNLFKRSNDGILVMDRCEPYTIRRANPAAAARLGVSGESLVGSSFLSLTPVGSEESLRRLLETVVRDGEGQAVLEHVTREGERLYNQITLHTGNFDGGPVCIAWIRDVSSAKRLESLLDVKKRILVMIAKDYPIGETLDTICQAVEEQTVGSVCTISLADEERDRLWVVAGSRLPAEFYHAVNGRAIRAQGSCGMAVMRNELIVDEDIASSQHWGELADVALREGLRSCCSAPIRTGIENTSSGVVTIFFKEARKPNDYDMQIMDKMSYLAGLAVERDGDKELKRWMELYKRISEHVTDFIWLIDERGSILYASPSSSRYGCIAQNGSPIWSFIDPEDVDAVKAAVFTAKAAYDRQLVEFRLVVDGEKTRILEAHAIPYSDGPGRPDAVLLATRDVTARKEKEQKLEESWQCFTSLYHNHPGAIYSFDTTGRFIGANAASEQITGYSFDELNGRTFDFLIKQEDVAYTREMFGMAAQGLSLSYNISLVHKDGHDVHLAVTNLPIVIDGNIVGVHGVSNDVSDKKRLIEELREARLELEEIIKNQAGLLFKLTRTEYRTMITMAGGQMLTALGYVPEEVSGRDWGDVFADAFPLEEVERHFTKAWNGEERVVFQSKRRDSVCSFLLNPIWKYGKVSEIVGLCVKLEESEPSEGKEWEGLAVTEFETLSSYHSPAINQQLSTKLTKRECEVAELIGSGKSNKEIAMELQISENTVKNHVANIFNKLNMEDRSQIVALLSQ
jgi:PAS domain S-box-containing protein